MAEKFVRFLSNQIEARVEIDMCLVSVDRLLGSEHRRAAVAPLSCDGEEGLTGSREARPAFLGFCGACYNQSGRHQGGS